jgi:hypothetical protein
VFGLALGYEDLIDHGELRHDPVLAAPADKLAAKRTDCAPLAGKSTLNRAVPTRYPKISHDPAQVRARWPRVRILLRADSGFAREEIMA